MDFEVGKLYRCPNFYLFIYPTKETAMRKTASACRATSERRAGMEEWTTFWTKKLNCQVYYSEPGEIFMVLKEFQLDRGRNFLHILFGEKQGWINYRDWLAMVPA